MKTRLPPWLRVEPNTIVRALGTAAMVMVLVLVNVIGAKYHRRVDVTTDKRFTLSQATRETLHTIGDRVEVYVLLGDADPLRHGIAQLMRSYRDECPQLDVVFVDPDRDAVRLSGLKQRFRIEAGRTEDGQVVTDAVIVVARGERHWFIGVSDLVAVAPDESGRVEPREEQALTRALREVTGGKKIRLCFTEGHGEMSTTDGSERGIAHLRDMLEKENYEVAVVDLASPDKGRPLEGCDAAVIAGPHQPFAPAEANRVRTFALEGGALAVFASPTGGAGATGMIHLGLDPALEPFGMALADALVVETEPSRVLPDSGGVRFFAEPRPHPVTAGLTEQPGGRTAPRAALQVARPVRRIEAPEAAVPVDLLVTGEGAYGITSLEGSAAWSEIPKATHEDLRGPLTVAMAAERPKLRPDAPHGPRAVVTGTQSPLAIDSFQAPLATRGAALYVESVMSWITAQPQMLDIPPHGAERPQLSLTEGSRDEIRRYVVYWMPGSAVLLALAVAFRRRSTEVRKPRSKASRKRKAS